MIKITKEFTFEMAHMLDGHRGGCKNLHGHTYKVMVEVGAEKLDGMEMVIDFKDLKKACNTMFDLFDHATAINLTSNDPFEGELAALLCKHGKKKVDLPFRSTAENMARYFGEYLGTQLPVGVKVTKVIVYETPTSYATWEAK